MEDEIAIYQIDELAEHLVAMGFNPWHGRGFPCI